MNRPQEATGAEPGEAARPTEAQHRDEANGEKAGGLSGEIVGPVATNRREETERGDEGDEPRYGDDPAGGRPLALAIGVEEEGPPRHFSANLGAQTERIDQRYTRAGQ